MPDNTIPPGKLPPDMLRKLLADYAKAGPGVVVGPGIGLDAAILDPGLTGEYLIAKTDPITLVAGDIGYYSLTINANDVACMGGTPRWFLATVLLPEKGTDYALVEGILRSMNEACVGLGVSLVGGHTEITRGLDRPIVIGQMLGTVKKNRLVTTSGARPGDTVILTKGIPIEAVSVIAREKKEELLGIYHEEFVGRCLDFVRTPGISVVEDARVAVGAGGVHCMHDPTEGGLSSGLYEIAEAAGVGIDVKAADIRILPEAFELIGRYGLDPLGCIASGALIITAAPDDAGRITAALEAAGIPAYDIGRVTADAGRVRLIKAGGTVDLPAFGADEITKIFSPADPLVV